MLALQTTQLVQSHKWKVKILNLTARQREPCLLLDAPMYGVISEPSDWLRAWIRMNLAYVSVLHDVTSKFTSYTSASLVESFCPGCRQPLGKSRARDGKECKISRGSIKELVRGCISICTRVDGLGPWLLGRSHFSEKPTGYSQQIIDFRKSVSRRKFYTPIQQVITDNPLSPPLLPPHLLPPPPLPPPSLLLYCTRLIIEKEILIHFLVKLSFYQFTSNLMQCNDRASL